MDAERTADLLARAVAGRPTPAAAVAVVTPEGTVASVTGGTADQETGQQVSELHRFDLASLTKTLVTLPEVVTLLSSGRLDLAAPLRAVWPRVEDRPAGALTVAELLSFRGGMPASPLYYRHMHRPEDMLEAYLDTVPEQRDPAVGVYSDVCFALAGAMVADLTGTALPVLAARRSGFCFTPVPGPAIATERCPWRGRMIVGEVHDENACAMGGVAGHAGAFGTLAQVAGALQQWLVDVENNPIAALTTTEWSRGADGERYGLGWLLPPATGISGQSPGPKAFGASGFVGNRVWLEPALGHAVIVLTNRIHPDRTVDRAPFDAWVSRLIDAVAEAA
jgi:CubicO group peptidase (beta-lactamase class C family)